MADLYCVAFHHLLVNYLRRTTLLSSLPGNDRDRPICVELAIRGLSIYRGTSYPPVPGPGFPPLSLDEAVPS